MLKTTMHFFCQKMKWRVHLEITYKTNGVDLIEVYVTVHFPLHHNQQKTSSIDGSDVSRKYTQWEGI